MWGLSRLNEGLTRVHDQAGSAAVLGALTQTAKSGVHTPDAKGTAKEGATASLGGTENIGGTDVEDETPLSLMELRGSTWAPLDGLSGESE